MFSVLLNNWSCEKRAFNNTDGSRFLKLLCLPSTFAFSCLSSQEHLVTLTQQMQNLGCFFVCGIFLFISTEDYFGVIFVLSCCSVVGKSQTTLSKWRSVCFIPAVSCWQSDMKSSKCESLLCQLFYFSCSFDVVMLYQSIDFLLFSWL